MKRLIAISVVFALAAGAAFAVDLEGSVIGTIGVIQGDNGDDSKPTSFGLFDRLRFEGSGENDGGTFGGWIRFETPWHSDNYFFEGLAWWKPIDQFKLTIGGNSDGIFAKEGHTAWMFYQRVTDTRLADGGDTGWGGGRYGFGLQTRHAFYGGFGGYGLLLDIKPLDMLSINLAVPFIDETGKPWAAAEPKNIFKKIQAQLDLNFDFGNIAVTYVGGLGLTPGVAGSAAVAGTDYYFTENSGKLEWTSTKPASDDDILDTKTVGGKPAVKAVDPGLDPGTIFAYFNLTSVENLGVDFGIGFPLPLKDDATKGVTYTYSNPLAVGLGVQYSAGDFGVKVRGVASFAGSVKIENDSGSSPDPTKIPMQVLFDVLPNYRINDNLKVFLSAGIGLIGSKTDANGDKVDDSSSFGFHINPYVWIGEEWGPSFWAGFKMESVKIGDGDAAVTWAIPIAMGITF